MISFTILYAQLTFEIIFVDVFRMFKIMADNNLEIPDFKFRIYTSYSWRMGFNFLKLGKLKKYRYQLLNDYFYKTLSK